jgi:acyl-CoA carboxylase subunit beta
MVETQIEAESNALFATGQGWDDGVIDPRDTRDVLGSPCPPVHSNEVTGTSSFGVFRM